MNFKKSLYKLKLNNDGEVVNNFVFKGIVNVEAGFAVVTPSGSVVPPGGKLNVGNATLQNNKKVTNFQELQQWVNEGGKSADKYQIMNADELEKETDKVSIAERKPTSVSKNAINILKVAINRELKKTPIDKTNVMDVLRLYRRMENGVRFWTDNEKIQQGLLEAGADYLLKEVGVNLVLEGSPADELREDEFDEELEVTDNTSTDEGIPVKDFISQNESEVRDFFGRALQSLTLGRLRAVSGINDSESNVFGSREDISKNLSYSSFLDSAQEFYGDFDLKKALLSLTVKVKKSTKDSKLVDLKLFEKMGDSLVVNLGQREINTHREDIVEHLMASFNPEIHESLKRSSIFEVMDFATDYFINKTPAEARKIAKLSGSLPKVLREATTKTFVLRDGNSYSLQDVLGFESEVERRDFFKQYVKALGSFIKDSSEFNGLKEGRQNIYKKIYDYITNPSEDYPSKRWPPDLDISEEDMDNYYNSRARFELFASHLSLLTSSYFPNKSTEFRLFQVVMGQTAFSEFENDTETLIRVLHDSAHDLGLRFSGDGKNVVSMNEGMKSFLEEKSGLSDSSEYRDLPENQKIYELAKFYSNNKVETDSFIAPVSRILGLDTDNELPNIESFGDGLTAELNSGFQEFIDKDFGKSIYSYGAGMVEDGNQGQSIREKKEAQRNLIHIRQKNRTNDFVSSWVSSGMIDSADEGLAKRYLLAGVEKPNTGFRGKKAVPPDVGNFTERAVNFAFAHSLKREGSVITMTDDGQLRVDHSDGSFNEILMSGSSFGFGDSLVTHVDAKGKATVMILEQKVHAGSTTHLYHIREVRPLFNVLRNLKSRYNVDSMDWVNPHQISIVNEGRNTQVIDKSSFLRNSEEDYSVASGEKLSNNCSHVILGYNVGNKLGACEE